MLYKLPNMDKLLKKMPLCKYFYVSKHFYARQMLNFRVEPKTPATSKLELFATSVKSRK